MAKKLPTIWPIEPHTKAKHEILRRYWQAWLPIISTRGGRVLYIDGFAGPGKYAGSEDGSPLVVLKSACNHIARPTSEVVFAFIEEDKARFDSLEGALEEIKPTLPQNFKVYADHGVFNDQMTNIFNHLDQQGARMAPSLVFVDPFGFAQTPFRTVERIMRTPHCEVLVTLSARIQKRRNLNRSRWDAIMVRQRPARESISPVERNPLRALHAH